jgi:hypothetical protein
MLNSLIFYNSNIQGSTGHPNSTKIVILENKNLIMAKSSFLAFDIGASSGRAILGILENNKIELVEIHRFKNQMTKIHGSYFWNIFSLFDELKTGLEKMYFRI